MNREIKFRGKRVDSDEWKYGYLVFSEEVFNKLNELSEAVNKLKKNNNEK